MTHVQYHATAYFNLATSTTWLYFVYNMEVYYSKRQATFNKDRRNVNKGHDTSIKDKSHTIPTSTQALQKKTSLRGNYRHYNPIKKKMIDWPDIAGTILYRFLNIAHCLEPASRFLQSNHWRNNLFEEQIQKSEQEEILITYNTQKQSIFDF